MNELVKKDVDVGLLVVDLFKYFDASKLDYIIMNGYEDYPDNIEGDIDICTSSLRKFSDVLQSATIHLNLKNVQMIHHHSDAVHYFIAVNNGSHKRIVFSLDVYSSYSFYTKMIFPSSFFLSGKKNKDFFYVAREDKELAYYLVKKIIKKQLACNKKLFSDRVHEIYNNKYINRLIPDNKNQLIYFLKGHGSCSVDTLQKDITKEIYRKSKWSLNLLYYEGKRRLMRFVAPTGVNIKVEGLSDDLLKSINFRVDKTELPFRRIDYLNKIVHSEQYKIVTFIKRCLYSIGLKTLYEKVSWGYYYLTCIRPLKVKSSLIIINDNKVLTLFNSVKAGVEKASFTKRAFDFFIPKPDIIISQNRDELFDKSKVDNIKIDILRTKTKKSHRYYFKDIDLSNAVVIESLLAVIETEILQLMAERKNNFY